ncbi:MAG: hypothetical protein P8179_05530 [Candidatus Thiodiazotropha sp.]
MSGANRIMVFGHAPYVREIVYGGNGRIVFLFSLGWVTGGWERYSVCLIGFLSPPPVLLPGEGCCKSMPQIFAKVVGCGEARTAS